MADVAWTMSAIASAARRRARAVRTRYALVIAERTSEPRDPRHAASESAALGPELEALAKESGDASSGTLRLLRFLGSDWLLFVDIANTRSYPFR
jgi:hypothetical protein